jgi:pleiotropic regulator 1
MKFWDWKSGYNYQSMDMIIQPGSLDAEAGIFASTFDRTGLRLITCNADKTIHIYGQDDEAVNPSRDMLNFETEETHPMDWKPTLSRRKF